MIRAGLVGAGQWGQTLVRAVQGKSDRICFVKAVTRTPSKAAGFGEEFGIPIDNDFEALLSDEGVDAVVLATPHTQHVDQIVRAAAAGKHIYVEKPLAHDGASARKAFAACREAGVVLALGHNRRCLPTYLKLRKLIEEGTLGKILHLEGNFSGPSAYRQTSGNWRADRSESPAGGMTGKGIHITDMMVSLAGAAREVSTISQRAVLSYGMDDTTLVMMRFASGPTGSLSTLTATPNDWRLQVYGSEAWAEIRDEYQLRLRDGKGEEAVEIFERENIERSILESFAETIETGSAFPVSEHDAVANTELLEAIIISIGNADGVPVPVPPAGSNSRSSNADN